MIKLNHKSYDIPTSFELGGIKVNVALDKQYNDSGNAGTAYLGTGSIRVKTSSNGEDYSKDYIQVTFYHELVHLILETMGRHELSKDESFVDLMATFLHQFNKTKK